MSYSVPVNFIAVLSFVIFFLYLMGMHSVLLSIGENQCEMTYMYEFPQFVEITLPPNVRQANPNYALFAYAEGSHTEKLRRMKFKGIPVLFIPGSSGSFKQGRSLASVSLRKAYSSRSPFYFDYFMIDFNEDESAFYGGFLEPQTKFVRYCIKKILSFYPRREGSPSSVILIGHSLGGFIAKSVFLDRRFPEDLVTLIISLAAPLKTPVLQLDPYVGSFYDNVNLYWEKYADGNHTTLISIGGGKRDFLVRPDLTHDPIGHINVLSTAVPGVWCSTDHQSIVWCKQLVLTIVRAIFDCIDVKTKQLATDHDTRYSIFKYHLLQRSAGKNFAENQHPRFETFNEDVVWHQNQLRQFSVLEKKGNKPSSYIMIGLDQDPGYENIFIESFNVNVKDWIYVCSDSKVYGSKRICESGENISNQTEIAPLAPFSKLKRKFVYLNTFQYKAKNFTHVVVKLPKVDHSFKVNVDVHDRHYRVINYTVPEIYSVPQKTIIKETENNSIYYEINLNGFESIWQGFVLGVETTVCKAPKHNAVISFMIPWASQEYHFYMNNKESISTKLTLTSTRHGYVNDVIYPYVRLNLDPACNYRVTIKPSLIVTASQVVIYYSGMIPAYITMVLLLTLRQQMLNLKTNESIFFHFALCDAVNRYYFIVHAAIFGSKILGSGHFLHYFAKPDLLAIAHVNADYIFMNVVLYGIAIIISYSSGVLCYLAAMLSGKTAHKIVFKFIAKAVKGLINWSEWVISVMQQAPIMVSAMLLSIAMSTSGALSLFLGMIFYFLKISNLFEDYLDDLFRLLLKFVAEKLKIFGRKTEEADNTEDTESETEEGNDNDESNTPSMSAVANENFENEVVEIEIETSKSCSLHFHVTLFLLWSLLTILNLPSLFVWARNYGYKVNLDYDPALIPSIALSICGFILWQDGVPYRVSAFSGVFSTIYFALAAIAVIYASVSIYRLSYIITAAIMVVTINQSIGKFFP